MKLIGLVRLGRDAEVRYTTSGDAVCEFSGAFDYGRAQGSDNKRPVQWVDFKLWGDRGEKLCPHLLKGQMLFVVGGEVHVEPYLSKQGNDPKARLVVRVDDVQFAGPKPDGEHTGSRTLAGQPGGAAAAAPPPSSAPPRSTPPGTQGAPAAPAMRSSVGRDRPVAPARSGTGFDDMDDDIPF